MRHAYCQIAIAFDNTTAVTANLCNSGSESNGCSGINMDEASQGECYQPCPGWWTLLPGRAVVAILSTHVITKCITACSRNPLTTEDCCGVLTFVGNSDVVNLCVIMVQ
jgi:hypothetical protein